MRFLRRSTPSPVGADPSAPAADGGQDAAPGQSPGKGRPTPKRRDAERRRRGPAPPPPRTQREAIKLARATKPDKTERRRRAAERRERMDAGDDRYLPPRDRGPVKAYIRDVVDSRRHIIGLFMPLAGLVFISIIVPVAAVQTYISVVAMAVMGSMIVEGIFLGRRIAAAARARFPGEEVKGFATGWYAFTRASQPRTLRVPRPRVARGTNL
ncbi:MAG: DUF3043 domain-containing protein [Pseudonocardia sp.]